MSPSRCRSSRRPRNGDVVETDRPSELGRKRGRRALSGLRSFYISRLVLKSDMYGHTLPLGGWISAVGGCRRSTSDNVLMTFKQLPRPWKANRHQDYRMGGPLYRVVLNGAGDDGQQSAARDEACSLLLPTRRLAFRAANRPQVPGCGN